MADILSPTNTVYVWGSQMVGRYGKEIHGSGLEVYQLKTAVNGP
jgi:hypothetical protein